MLDDVVDPAVARSTAAISASRRPSDRAASRVAVDHAWRLAPRHDQAETDHHFVAAATDLIGKVQCVVPRRLAGPVALRCRAPGSRSEWALCQGCFCARSGCGCRCSWSVTTSAVRSAVTAAATSSPGASAASGTQAASAGGCGAGPGLRAADPGAERHQSEEVQRWSAQGSQRPGHTQLVAGVGDHQLVAHCGEEDAGDDRQVQVGVGVAAHPPGCFVGGHAPHRRRRLPPK